jgi:hypothetical protein
MILPISQRYEYRDLSDGAFEAVLNRIKRATGIATGGPRKDLAARIRMIWAALVEICQENYRRFSDLVVPDSPGLQARIDALTAHVVMATERALHLKGHGSLIHRLMYARELSWDWTYRSDIPDPAVLSPLDRDAANTRALEGFLISRWIEVADLLYYQRMDYIDPPADRNRLMESALSAADFVVRMRGGTIAGRPARRYARVIFSVGREIPVTPFAAQGPARDVIPRILADITAQYQELQSYAEQ